MKKIVCFLVVLVSVFAFFPLLAGAKMIDEFDEIVVEEESKVFQIFDEDGNFVTEKSGVVLGDIIIDNDFKKFEIVFVDEEKLLAKAKFVERLEKPKIHKKTVQEIEAASLDKKIGLYSTHNDESYILGDGVESVYGKGGIHDVGSLLATHLNKQKIETRYDQALHIPHDNMAYSRSRQTAQNLLAWGATAIFDIHRDGASRSFYLTENEGKQYSKVRIVIGQGNKNQESNLQFALWFVSVAETLYPWMIADIYLGKGTYNQNLSSKALLFEMGCHQIEKEYVLRSVPCLTDVIITTLFGTTVEEETNSLTIGGNLSASQENTVDEVLEKKMPNKASSWHILSAVAVVALAGGFVVVGVGRRKWRTELK